MKLTLNQALVESLGIEARQYEIYDAAQDGLFLRVRKSGTKTYYMRHKGKIISLGNADVVTLETVRETLLLKYDIRDTSRKPPVNMTVEKFYYKEMCGYIATLKPKTQKEFHRNIIKYILPIFKKRSLSSITIAEVRDFHYSMRNTKYQANRVLSSFSRMFSLAHQLEMIFTNNPCKDVKKFKEQKRERYLSHEELVRLKKYLYEHRETDTELIHSLLIEFLILTGCRVSEALNLEKSHARGAMITWDDTKTGTKELPMTSRLRDIIINAGTRNPTDKVFARYKVCSHGSLARYWKIARTTLHLEEIRLHDLRHTFASFAVRGGFELTHVRDLLNHKDIASTARYVHTTTEDIKSAMDNIANKMGF